MQSGRKIDVGAWRIPQTTWYETGPFHPPGFVEGLARLLSWSGGGGDHFFDELDIDSDFEVLSYPNPSASEFTVQVFSSIGEPLDVRVSDLQGRLLYQVKGQQEIFHFGADFMPGMYIIAVTQGNRQEVMRLVKQ